MASVWQLSVRHQGSGSSVRGVILKSNPIFHGTRRGGFINMLRVIRSYFIKPLARKTINLRIDEQEFQATTNSRGEFMFDVESKLGDVKSVELAGQKLEFVFDYPEVFPKGIGDYEVISDIDDTIMISYTADTIKRITTLLFTDPLKRRKIDYTHQLYEHFVYQHYYRY